MLEYGWKKKGTGICLIVSLMFSLLSPMTVRADEENAGTHYIRTADDLVKVAQEVNGGDTF